MISFFERVFAIFGVLDFCTLRRFLFLLVALCNLFCSQDFSVARSLGFLCLFVVTGVFFDIRGLDFCIFVGWCFSPDASYRFTAQIIINRFNTMVFQASWSRMFFVYGPFLVCRTGFFRCPVFGFFSCLSFSFSALHDSQLFDIFRSFDPRFFFRDRLLVEVSCDIRCLRMD